MGEHLNPLSSAPSSEPLQPRDPCIKRTMCSRGDRGCHSTESSFCHRGGSSCHGSEELTCHEVTAVQDVTPVVVLPPQGPVVTVPGQVPVPPAPCQQQQIKQPAQWPPQQQK